MKTIIAGSRTATKMHVWHAWRACPWRDEIGAVLSGCARGADTHGEGLAGWLGVPVGRYPADWDTHGKRAGILRNCDMAAQADALIAVWDGKSRGTKHMIDEARRRGLRVFVYTIPKQPTAPYVPGSDTSKSAADAIAPHMNSLQRRIYDHIQSCSDGATADEVEVALGLLHQTTTARIDELLNKKGMIVDSGKRRLTRHGRKARVLVVA